MRRLIAKMLRRIADVFYKEKDWKAEAIDKAAAEAKEVDISSGMEGFNIESKGVVDAPTVPPKFKFVSEPPKVAPPEKRVLTEVQINTTKPKPVKPTPDKLKEKLKETWDSV